MKYTIKIFDTHRVLIAEDLEPLTKGDIKIVLTEEDTKELYRGLKEVIHKVNKNLVI